MTDQRRKRPRDPAQLAKFVIDIATGEVEDKAPLPLSKKQAAEIGGRRRAQKLTPKRKTEIATKAAKARWSVKS